MFTHIVFSKITPLNHDVLYFLDLTNAFKKFFVSVLIRDIGM